MSVWPLLTYLDECLGTRDTCTNKVLVLLVHLWLGGGPNPCEIKENLKCTLLLYKHKASIKKIHIFAPFLVMFSKMELESNWG